MTRSTFKPVRILPGMIVLLATLTLLATLPLNAQTATILAPVALAPVQRDAPVEMVALTLDATITESGGHTWLAGNTTFKLHNLDKANDVQVPVGFPSWAGDPFVFDPAKFESFAITLEGKKVSPTLSRADLRIGGTVRSVDWYTFTLPLAVDEKKTVRVDFQQDLGESSLPRFAYGLLPAVSWKGSIGSGRLTLRLPTATTPEQLAAYEPATATFDGSSLTWRFTNHEPPVNPTLTLLRPSLWNELSAKRRSVQQNPNEPSAHTALGTLFRQLAAVDSPRRDSYYSQAIAEFAMATSLDPKSVAAHQALGTLYETRAGQPTGPRQAAYVLLAVAEWEPLAATDAGARKQLAEDYFYLSTDAQNRAAYAEALAYLDKAQATMPNGAGPLYTAERATAQRRTANASWAKAALEREDWNTAYDKARGALGDAFMASFNPPPFVVASARVTMSAHARTTVLRLSPFASQPADLAKSINAMMPAWRATGSDAAVVAEGSDLVLTLSTPFNTAAELIQRLAELVQALPDRAEWSLVRAVSSPRSLDWTAPSAVPPGGGRYTEQVDLAPACGATQKQLDSLGQSIKPLESATAADVDAQLKRALLKNAQSGWQRALVDGRVTFTNGAGDTTVDACGTKTVAFASTPFPWGMVAIIAGTSGLFCLGIAGLWWRARKKRRKATAGLYETAD